MTFDPAQKMLYQGDAPEGSDTFQWPVIERDHVGGLRLIIWDKVKFPLCQYRLMHRKRVTSELHDSYFRMMRIYIYINLYFSLYFKDPVGERVGVGLLFN